MKKVPNGPPGTSSNPLAGRKVLRVRPGGTLAATPSIGIPVALLPALADEGESQQTGNPEDPDDDHQCDSEITHRNPR